MQDTKEVKLLLADIKVSGLAEAEANAKAILEHVEAIKTLVAHCSYPGIKISVDIKNEEVRKNDAI